MTNIYLIQMLVDKLLLVMSIRTHVFIMAYLGNVIFPDVGGCFEHTGKISTNIGNM